MCVKEKSSKERQQSGNDPKTQTATFDEEMKDEIYAESVQEA